jgi:GntR family transcriptional regulator
MPPRPRFIAHLIRRSIAAGEFSPGVALPPADELAERYRASPEESRLALARLDAEGLIAFHDDLSAVVRQPSTQTHVMSLSAPLGKPLPSRADQFSAAASEVGLSSAHRMKTTTIGPASLDVADRLEIDVGQQVVHWRTVRLANDEPSVLEDSFCPHDIAAGTDPIGVGDLDELLHALGYVRVGWNDAVTARTPRPDEAALLTLEPDRPVIDHDRVLYAMQLTNRQIRPVSYVRTVFVGDRNRLTYHHKQSDVPLLDEPTN